MGNRASCCRSKVTEVRVPRDKRRGQSQWEPETDSNDKENYIEELKEEMNSASSAAVVDIPKFPVPLTSEIVALSKSQIALTNELDSITEREEPLSQNGPVKVEIKEDPSEVTQVEKTTQSIPITEIESNMPTAATDITKKDCASNKSVPEVWLSFTSGSNKKTPTNIIMVKPCNPQPEVERVPICSITGCVLEPRRLPKCVETPDEFHRRLQADWDYIDTIRHKQNRK